MPGDGSGLQLTDWLLFFIVLAGIPVFLTMLGRFNAVRMRTGTWRPIHYIVQQGAGIALMWAITALILVHWLAEGRPWALLGLSSALTPGLVIAAVFVAAVCAFYARALY